MQVDWFFQAIIAIAAVVALVLPLFRSTKQDGKWEGSVNTKIETLEKLMDEVREDIRDIKNNILDIFKRLPAKAISSESPMTLTDLGEKISKEIQASAWAKQTAPSLAIQNRGKGHYDIQEFCLIYVEEKSNLSEEMDRKVKASAYNNGIEKEQVLKVLAVELRNVIFEELNMDKDANY